MEYVRIFPWAEWRVSHAAVTLASRVGCLLVWIGDGGVRVRKMYELLARQYRVKWKNRNYDYTQWESGGAPSSQF
jgi:CRISPR/Cas system-associated endonuclease Cas1